MSHFGSGGKQEETLAQEVAGSKLAVERDADPALKQAEREGAQGEAAAAHAEERDPAFKPTAKDKPLPGDASGAVGDVPEAGAGGGGEAGVTGDTAVLD